MPLDVVAIVTPTAGKEARVEELLAGLAANVQSHEPDVEQYIPTKVVGKEGTPEYVVIERYKDQSAYEAHFKTDHFQDLAKLIEAEGILAKPLNIMTLQPLGGFESR